MSGKVFASLVLALIGGGAVAAIAYADTWTSSQDSSSGTIVSACSFFWPAPQGDDDCDGWTSADENFVGTNPSLACGAGAWPPDFNDDQNTNIFDVYFLRPAFFSTFPGPLYDTRIDLLPDGSIDIFDINRFKPFFFLSCTP